MKTACAQKICEVWYSFFSRVNLNKDSNEKQVYYVEPRYLISFKADSNFDYSVNENDFKIVSDKRNNTLNRENRKPVIRSKTKRVTDLINKANKRKGK